jgi:hypothetical protein
MNLYLAGARQAPPPDARLGRGRSFGGLVEARWIGHQLLDGADEIINRPVRRGVCQGTPMTEIAVSAAYLAHETGEPVFPFVEER